MFKHIKNDYVGWLVIFGATILVLETLFFNKGLIFSLFLSGMMIYLGRRKRHGSLFGKFLFFGGIILFIINIFNMMTFKFLLLAILLHFFIQYMNRKKHPNKLSPKIAEPEMTQQQETMVSSTPLFENRFIGQQKTPNGVYEWNDINIQTGIGDTIIDLSYTMLPKGETVILIRNIIGNIHILVPYEIEVSVYHTGIIGNTNVFGNHNQKMFNQVFQLKTPDYERAGQKVKIFTTLLAGNLEVSRI